MTLVVGPMHDYLKNKGEYKSPWFLYNDLSAATLTLTGSPPAGNFKLRIDVLPKGIHTDIIGTVQVNAETPLVFSGTNTSVWSVATLSAVPTVKCVGLDCKIRVICTATTGTPPAIMYFTDYPLFNCMWIDTTQMFLSSTGTWTQAIGKVVAETDYELGEYIRKPGTIIDRIIKRCSVAKDLDGNEMYRVFML